MRSVMYECGETVLAVVSKGDGEERITISEGEPSQTSSAITISQDEANDLIVALINLLEGMGGVTTLYASGYSRDL